MIEPAINTSLINITAMPVYPLVLPGSVREGITFQRISDPRYSAGMVITHLVQARFQIGIHVMSDYERALKLDKAICDAWEPVVHGHIGSHPVQTVQRGGFQQTCEELTDNTIRWSVMRDFIITYPEDVS